MPYCSKCGTQVKEDAKFCPECGERIERGYRQEYHSDTYYDFSASGKSRLVAAILCFFFGIFGVHRFYAGKIGTGILWLLTMGLCGIGATIDFIIILCGYFKDSDGRVIRNWMD